MAMFPFYRRGNRYLPHIRRNRQVVEWCTDKMLIFLGFPYLEIDPAFKEINNGYPQPFVKKGIVANMSPGLLFLDGHNNPGFSGGPVVFNTPQSRDYKIAGVVSGYRATSQPVKEHEQDSSSITFDENAGIVVAYSINFAIDLIKSNPIGAPVNYGA